MNRRLTSLRTRLDQLGLDAWYCRHTPNIRWLTGFEGVFDEEEAHLVLVTAQSALLHTDGRYSEAMRSRKESGSFAEDISISDERISHATFAARELALALDGHIRIGVENSIKLGEYRKFESELSEAGLDYEIVGVDDPIIELRAVKDASEIEAMRRAQEITDRAFADLLGWICPGMTELEVANEMEYRMRADGAQGLAFSSIVASGPNSAMPHAIPSDRRLEKGDLVVIDFGAAWGDYRSDMTRTIAISEPEPELKRIYDTVLRAHEECKEMIRAGVFARNVHELAENIIADAGYKGRFTHSLGHGVGISIHENPVLSARAEGPLEAGNVVTVEPGIYVPGLGGVRIEDFGAVTADGFDAFTRSPHELQVV